MDIPLLVDDDGNHASDAEEAEVAVAVPLTEAMAAAPLATGPLEPPRKVPITIITGYLGSGKLTLIDYIALNSAGRKYAVIVNEFGNLALVERSKLFKITEGLLLVDLWLDLGNGCLCCLVKDMGVAAIELLLQRSRNSFDQVILETSGLADPGPIANMFWLDEGLGLQVGLDGVVCVVDGVNGLKYLQEEEAPTIAHMQIAHADVVVLNKMDVVEQMADSAAHLAALRLAVTSINRGVKIVETRFSRIDRLLDILELHSFEQFTPTVPDAHAHQHDDRISTISLSFPVLTPAQFAKFDEFIRYLLWERPQFDTAPLDILRTKGLCVVDDGGQLSWRVVQGVRETYDVFDGADLSSEGEPHGVLVLIGGYLQRQQDAIITAFEARTGITVTQT